MRVDNATAGVIGIVLATALVAAIWVYVDAKEHAGQGRSITLSVGSLRLETPSAWFLACLVLGELFIPAYMDSRHPA